MIGSLATACSAICPAEGIDHMRHQREQEDGDERPLGATMTGGTRTERA